MWQYAAVSMSLTLFKLLAFVLPALHAAPISDTVSKLQKSWDDAKTYQAQFKQTISSKVMGTKDENSGEITVSKPDRLKWESKTEGNTQILNGKKLVNIQENKRRKNRTVDIYTDVRKRVGGTALGFLAGRAKFADLYNVKVLSETPKIVELKLSPKKEGGDPMVVEVNKSNYLLAALTTENQESKVRIEFSNIKTNVKLDENLFEFKSQPNDVVHEE